MGFSKKEYKIYKKWMDQQFAAGFHLNPAVYTSLPADNHFGTCVDIAVQIFSDAVHSENWEAAKATKDSIRDFFARFGEIIPDDMEIKIRLPTIIGKEAFMP